MAATAEMSKTAQGRTMHQTRIDLSESTRSKMVELLNQRLADVIDLQLQSKQAHWNVRGPEFIALHKLFDEVAEKVETYVDEIAERITALGGLAESGLAVLAKRSQLPPYPAKIEDSLAHVDAMATALATFGKLVREDIDTCDEAGDAGTADLFTQVSRAIDQLLWFVEAHLQGKQ
jgi:starvation-inducible DNA-binding protein